jgi:hypothetical protein
VKLHHVGVGIGQGKGRADPAGGADRAEQIGVVIALVGGLPWPRSTPGPLPNLPILLADPVNGAAIFLRSVIAKFPSLAGCGDQPLG